MLRVTFPIRPKAIVGAPDLVVEVLSTYSLGRDQVTKRHLYERSGVPEYWIVDPHEQTVHALRLSSGRYRARRVTRATRP